MNIEKLPSGSYRISKQVRGIRYRVTVKHKPSQEEVEALIQEKINGTYVSMRNLTENIGITHANYSAEEYKLILHFISFLQGDHLFLLETDIDLVKQFADFLKTKCRVIRKE